MSDARSLGAREAPLAHHFEDRIQQREAATLGMWTFLISEVMFFGGLFAAYVVYRNAYPEAFAEGSHELDVVLGTFNTAVLIGSSLTMALSIHAAQHDERSRTAGYLLATIGLGLVFLGVKAIEYGEKIAHHHLPGPSFQWDSPLVDQARIFYSLYFAMTGMHAFHMVVGLGLLAWLVVGALRGRFGKHWTTPLEMVGLYWHFVDIVWIFLFPLLYLIGRHG